MVHIQVGKDSLGIYRQVIMFWHTCATLPQSLLWWEDSCGESGSGPTRLGRIVASRTCSWQIRLFPHGRLGYFHCKRDTSKGNGKLPLLPRVLANRDHLANISVLDVALESQRFLRKFLALLQRLQVLADHLQRF